MMVTFAAAIFGAAMIYQKSMFPAEPVNIAFGTTISFVQSLSVVGSFDITYPSNVEDGATRPASVFALDFNKFKVPYDCVSGTSFLQRYMFQMASPLLLAAGFLSLLLLSTAIKAMTQKVLNREVASLTEVIPERGCCRRLFNFLEAATTSRASGLPPLSKRLDWYWPAKWLDIQNAILLSQNGLFIILTKAAVSIFTHKTHPDGQVTLYHNPEVTYYSSAWWSALPVALFGLTVYSIGFMALVIFLVWVAPQRNARDLAFRTRYRGLWIKFDMTGWWFILVQLLYGLSLNMLPVFSENNRLQVMNATIVNFGYVLVVSHVHPWKFRLNHYVDLFLKLGSTGFVLLSMNLQQDDPLDKNTIGWLMLSTSILPLGVVAGAVLHFIWKRDISVVAAHQIRANFAQRLHDIVKVVGAKSTFDLRALCMDIHDNDLVRLDIALDVLQFCVLGLQPQHRFKWRCAEVPFEVAVRGRLEGELLACGKAEHADARMSLRKLRKSLKPDALEDKQKSWKSSTSSLQKAVIGLTSHMSKMFKTIDTNHNGCLEESEFAQMILTYLNGTAAEHGITDEELYAVYRYIDMDQSGGLTIAEFAHALEEIAEPVYPRWWCEKDGGHYGRPVNHSLEEPIDDNQQQVIAQHHKMQHETCLDPPSDSDVMSEQRAISSDIVVHNFDPDVNAGHSYDQPASQDCLESSTMPAACRGETTFRSRPSQARCLSL